METVVFALQFLSEPFIKLDEDKAHKDNLSSVVRLIDVDVADVRKPNCIQLE